MALFDGTTAQGVLARSGGVGMLMLAMLAAIGVVTLPTVQAQAAEWWEQLPGFGGAQSTQPRRRSAQDREAAERQQFEDLRPNATPWLSEETIKIGRAHV